MFNSNLFKLAALVGLAVIFSSCSKFNVNENIKSHLVVNVSAFSLSWEDFLTKTEGSDSPASRLSFAVFDSEGAPVGEVIHQESSYDGFGTVEMDLYPGEYQLVAVAHCGNADAVLNSPSSAVLPGTLLSDTFAKVQNLTVIAGEDCNLGMTLPRVTSAFILRLTDTPPANAKEIEVVVNTGGLASTSLEFDPSSGMADNNWKLSSVIPVANLAADDVPIYFMSMYPVSVVSVKATAYDTEGDEIISHTISNVTMTPNKKTVATGNFFKSQGSGTFTLETEWDADNQVSY